MHTVKPIDELFIHKCIIHMHIYMNISVQVEFVRGKQRDADYIFVVCHELRLKNGGAEEVLRE
jgi:hypothetical protein